MAAQDIRTHGHHFNQGDDLRGAGSWGEYRPGRMSSSSQRQHASSQDPRATSSQNHIDFNSMSSNATYLDNQTIELESKPLTRCCDTQVSEKGGKNKNKEYPSPMLYRWEHQHPNKEPWSPATRVNTSTAVEKQEGSTAESKKKNN